MSVSKRKVSGTDNVYVGPHLINLGDVLQVARSWKTDVNTRGVILLHGIPYTLIPWRAATLASAAALAGVQHMSRTANRK
jgi:hypothetical protein